MLSILIIGILLILTGLYIFRIKPREQVETNVQLTPASNHKSQTTKSEIIATKNFCIFLDFEGVLFTNGNKDYRFLPNVYIVLDKFPGAEIVIASILKLIENPWFFSFSHDSNANQKTNAKH